MRALGEWNGPQLVEIETPVVCVDCGDRGFVELAPGAAGDGTMKALAAALRDGGIELCLCASDDFAAMVREYAA